MSKRIKGGHPIILSDKARNVYISRLAKQYDDWHKIGGLSPYKVQNGIERQKRRETKLDKDILDFIKNHEDYNDAIFNWNKWQKFVSYARKALKTKTKTKRSRATEYITNRPDIKVIENKTRPSPLSRETEGQYIDRLQKKGITDPRILKDLLETRREVAGYS